MLFPGFPLTPLLFTALGIRNSVLKISQHPRHRYGGLSDHQLLLNTNMQLLQDSLFQWLPVVAKHFHIFHVLTSNSGNALIFILNAKLEFQHVILWGSHVGSHRLCSIFPRGAHTSSMKRNSSPRATHAMKSIDIVVITCQLYDIRVILSLYPLYVFIIAALYFHYIRSSFPQYLFKSFILFP